MIFAKKKVYKDEQSLPIPSPFLHQHSHNHNFFQYPPDTFTMAATVLTTRPILKGNLPLPILSNRLIIRSLSLSDLEAYHILLSQPEAMEGNNMSPDISYTEIMLEDELPPYDSQIYLGIFLKKSDNSDGDLIGDGGIYHLQTQGEWPELSYRFKKEYWNNGYATEFVIAFMRFWWSLPREPTTLQVHPSSVGFQNTHQATERVYASVKLENKASQRVLEKAGFKLFEGMGSDWLTHWRNIFSEEWDLSLYGRELADYFSFNCKDIRYSYGGTIWRIRLNLFLYQLSSILLALVAKTLATTNIVLFKSTLTF